MAGRPDLFPSIVKEFQTARQEARSQTLEAALVAAVQGAIDSGGLVKDVLPTTKVLEVYNASLPEKAQLTEYQIGIRLNNIGFPAKRVRVGAGPKVRGRVIDDEQLAALKEKFGLVDGDEREGE